LTTYSFPVKNSLFAQSVDSFTLKPKKNHLKLHASINDDADVTWFANTPKTETGKITTPYFQSRFNTFFPKNKPNASITWPSDTDISQTATFQIKRIAKGTGEGNYIFKIKPLDKQNKALLNETSGSHLKNANLFIDSSDNLAAGGQAQGIAQAVKDAGIAIGGGLAVGTLAYQGYLKYLQIMQARTQLAYEENLKAKIEQLFGEYSSSDDDGALRIYTKKVEKYIDEIQNFGAEYDNFADFKKFIDEDEFTLQIRSLWDQEMSIEELGDFITPADFEEIKGLLYNAARGLKNYTYQYLASLYQDEGYDEVVNFFTDTMNQTEGWLLTDAQLESGGRSVFTDWFAIAKELDPMKASRLRKEAKVFNRVTANQIDGGLTASEEAAESIEEGISDSVGSEVSSLVAAAIDPALAAGEAAMDAGYVILEACMEVVI
jgi:hypothetical protein